MHNQAKQLNIPAELADNLIDSLGDLTAIEGDELRRQVIMLIDHSYALGYVAGADAGRMARMRSMLALAWQDINPALSTIRERLSMILRDHGRHFRLREEVRSGLLHLLPRWMLHPQPIGLDGEEIETGCELKGLALRRTYG